MVVIPMNRAGEPSPRRFVRSGVIEVALIAAATLQSGETVDVELYEWQLWGPLEGDGSKPPLVLRVDRGPGITSVGASQNERSKGTITIMASCSADGGDCPLADGLVRLDPPAVGDGQLPLGYDPSDFPLGTTTRTVEFTSPNSPRRST